MPSPVPLVTVQSNLVADALMMVIMMGNDGGEKRSNGWGEGRALCPVLGV